VETASSAISVSLKALQQQTLCAAFQATAAERASELALRTKGGAVEVTWAEYAARVRSAAAGLSGLGVEAGDTIGLMLVNRPEFHVLDTAAMHLGATTFSIYNTSPADEIAHVVRDAGARLMVTEQAFIESLTAAGLRLEQLIVVDGPLPGTIDLAEIEDNAAAGFDFEAVWREVRPEDLLVLIYTSGTTGPPKGVQLTHSNLLACLRGLSQLLEIEPGGRMISYFPMAHIAERYASQYLPMVLGATVTCCPNPREIGAYLPEVRPTGFFAAPRIWEKLKSGVEASIQSDPDEARRERTLRAIEVSIGAVQAEQRHHAGEEEPRAQLGPGERELLAGIRSRLGLDQVGWVATGAAPTPDDVVEFFHALGIPIGEHWGLSETSGAATAGPPGAVRIGTAGKPLPGVEVTLDADGEVLVRGPTIMAGYRNADAMTRQVIDPDGWFHTGDIGEIDGDGYLWIVDRKKELIINAAGKNMSPANIEARIKSSSQLIGQCAAIGNGRPYNVALIVLDPDGCAAYAGAHGLRAETVRKLAAHPKIVEEVTAAVGRANTHLARVAQIKRFVILADEWQPGTDQLTPTMKLKRRAIETMYAREIESLYEAAVSRP
jgi:long-chain acyl-CoA synthetase